MFLAQFKINNMPIEGPEAIKHIPNASGPLGEGILRLGIILLFIAGVLYALFMIILGGIQWITSEGDKTKLQTARNKITYAVIGLLIMFVSFLLITIIGYIFNVPLLKLP